MLSSAFPLMQIIENISWQSYGEHPKWDHIRNNYDEEICIVEKSPALHGLSPLIFPTPNCRHYYYPLITDAKPA